MPMDCQNSHVCDGLEKVQSVTIERGHAGWPSHLCLLLHYLFPECGKQSEGRGFTSFLDDVQVLDQQSDVSVVGEVFL